MSTTMWWPSLLQPSWPALWTTATESLLVFFNQRLLQSIGPRTSLHDLFSVSRLFDHTTLALRQLHWLLVVYRVQYKLSILMHAIANKETPIYLRELVQHVSETVTPSNLRSSTVTPSSNHVLEPSSLNERFLLLDQQSGMHCQLDYDRSSPKALSSDVSRCTILDLHFNTVSPTHCVLDFIVLLHV